MPSDIELQLKQGEDALPPIELSWNTESRKLAAMGRAGRSAAQGYNDKTRAQVDAALDAEQANLEVWEHEPYENGESTSCLDERDRRGRV